MIWGDTSMKGHTDPDLLPTGTLTGWYWVVPQTVELFSNFMWGSWLWIPFDRGQCLVICDQLGGQCRDINWVLISLDLKLKESGMLHITYPMLPIHTLFRRSLITSIWIWEQISCDIVLSYQENTQALSHANGSEEQWQKVINQVYGTIWNKDMFCQWDAITRIIKKKHTIKIIAHSKELKNNFSFLFIFVQLLFIIFFQLWKSTKQTSENQ